MIKKRYIIQRIAEDEGTTKAIVIASTDSPDRYGDIVDQGTWQLDRYRANPVLLQDHSYTVDSIVGKAEVQLSPAGLVAELTFDDSDDNPAGRRAAGLFARGMLNAVSVGFTPSEAIPRSSFPADDPRYAARGNYYKNNELLEISTVAIPANPDATALGRAAPESSLRDEIAELLKTDDQLLNLIKGVVWSAPAVSSEDATAPAEVDGSNLDTFFKE